MEPRVSASPLVCVCVISINLCGVIVQVTEGMELFGVY